MSSKLRMAMVGGGPGSFIGPLHALGAHLSGRVQLVAGAFSTDATRSRTAAVEFGVSPERCYDSYEEMFAAERRREDPIELVAIATPNHLHLPIALRALSEGLHIISDKPPTATLSEALTLRDALNRTDRRYALTFSYTGFPMVREARARVLEGEIGRVRKVVVTYSQGWLSNTLEKTGNARAQWRMDPKKSGAGGCSADIGVHAFNLAEYVTGDRVQEICADLHSFGPGRALDDDCNVLMHFRGGAAGALISSQVAFGERNGLSLQVYGEAGSVHWSVEQPEALRLTTTNAVALLGPLSPGLLTREPLIPGIGAGLAAPFAIQYRDFARAIAGEAGIMDSVLPGIEAGVRSMRFVEGAVANSASRAGWVSVE